MKLIKYEGYNLTIEPELLTIRPFKKLWERDKTKTKWKALLELAYIYFMLDPRSDYQLYIDEQTRSAQIKEGQGMSLDWQPDATVLDAMQYYSLFKPVSALLLEDTRVAIDKLRKLLREIDLNATDDKGKPIYTLNTVTSTIKQIPELVKGLDEAEKAIASEIAQSDKVRGSQTKSIYEDL